MKTLLHDNQQRINQALIRYLPVKSNDPADFNSALHYVIFNGGKRLRALLVYTTGMALGALESELDPLAASIEFIHAYSLVHDDLPAMDNDELRRGKPTCHRAYDEATAILVGDGLQALAFETLSQTAPSARFSPTQQLKMIQTLAKACGVSGMVKGQAIDINATGKNLSYSALETMHRYKTGALIEASVTLGALAAPNCSDELLEKLQSYAQKIGLAFQIQDDILDTHSEQDTKANKPNYPALLGLQGAQQKANELIAEAKLAIADLNLMPLNKIADYVVQRSF